MTVFTYQEFTTRNLGFVSEDEQTHLRNASVFVCGTGGMGGSAIMTLIRAGVGRLILADLDAFEVSNLNRQLFATLKTVDQDKAQATRDQCLQINPEADIEVLGADWTDHVERLVQSADVVVNGTDDLGASLLLYRTARAKGRAVIDAYASPLPSVYVTVPGDPMPEERLDYTTRGTNWNELTSEMRDAAAMAEAEYVLTHSSSRHHVDLALAGEVIAGTRSRMSFAPMVIMAGTLMGGEALQAVLGRSHGADYRGWFLNPHTGRVERPLPSFIATLMRPLVRRQMERLLTP
ncbi:ThiF family adenylyltransferase [Ruegeria sp. Ofav3-42]|uniref:ThiF family adenylyltransferase n=1 Tax=Ruegeria sp. Ofav3-42 TaxID=2917759 RepID=UPI001EF495D3|nr:ThiF family adenylyltransferase [Ruegeria sp. Ofav3-42]MCG7522433.1 ThiF family adenylyltransferase [Ruegeria sp. Ofav3-42]